MKLIEKINDIHSLKKLSISELGALSDEIRDFLIDSISETGGHLASNLGVVDLTLALHYVFDSPKDHIIWDVSHQIYTQKIITGRRGMMATLRQKDGLSGYSSRDESEHDKFEAGHASTSLSAAYGFAYSSTVTFILYILPLLFKLKGSNELLNIVDAIIDEPFVKKGDKTNFTACNVYFKDTSYHINFDGKKNGTSAILTNMLGDTGLLIQDQDSKDLQKGDRVKVILL